MILLSTDGGYRAKTKQGGWAFRAQEFEPVPNTWGRGGAVTDGTATNQRMEMLAIVEGLNDLKGNSYVLVQTDSQYVAYTMTRGWKRRVNNDLWDALDAAKERHLEVLFDWRPRNSTDGLDWCDAEAKRQTKIEKVGGTT